MPSRTDAQSTQMPEPQTLRAVVKRGKFGVTGQQMSGKLISPDLMLLLGQVPHARGNPKHAEHGIGVAGSG